MDLLTIGEAFDDLIFSGLPRLPLPGEELRVASLSHQPGGGAIITAVASARLGLRTATISAVSDLTSEHLAREGVALTNLRKPSERAAISVALSTRRDRSFVTFEGVNRVLEPRLLRTVSRRRPRPRHVHFALSPRRCAAWIPVLGRLRKRRITSSWDFGWNVAVAADAGLPRLLSALDYVFVNEQEAPLYARTRTMAGATRRWRSLTRCTVIKMGENGALVLSAQPDAQARAPRARVVDTTGAGDAFNAGFLSARLHGASLSQAVKLGNFVGSASTRAVGGIAGLPFRHTLPAWAIRVLETA